MSDKSPRSSVTNVDIHPNTQNLWDRYVRVIRDRGVSELIAIKRYVKDKRDELADTHGFPSGIEPLGFQVEVDILETADAVEWTQSMPGFALDEESASIVSNFYHTFHCLHTIDMILQRYCMDGVLENWDGTPADVRSKVERSELAPGWLCTRAQRQQLFERLRRHGFGEVDPEGEQFIWSGSNYAAELGFLAGCLARRGLIPDIAENDRTHGAEFLRANFKRPDGHMDLQSLKNQWRVRSVDSIDTDLKRSSAKRRYRQIADAVADPEASGRP